MSWRSKLDYALNAGRNPTDTLPKDLAQIRVISSISYVYILSGILIASFHFTQGLPIVGWVITTALIFGCINITCLFHFNHIRWNAHATVAIIFGSGLLSNMIWGGYGGPNFAWLLFIPILAALVINCRAMWGYFCVLVLTIAALIILQKHGVLPLYPDYIPHFALAVVINRFGILALLCMVLQAFYTERTRYENGINESNRAARIASREKDEFIATITHEIRTPMIGILSMADALLKTKMTSDQKFYVNVIHQSGKSIVNLVNDAQDYSKIETGELTLRRNEFDLHATLASTLSLFGEQASNKNIDLNYYIPQNLPRLLVGDELRYKQILTSLLTNAVKYTEKGAINIGISFDLMPNQFIQIITHVIDTGIGISKANLKKISESFKQSDDSILNRLAGMGLGLTIAQRLACLMEGSIFVESEVGNGSDFYFTCKMKLVGAMNDEEQKSYEERKIVSYIHYQSTNTENILKGHVLVAEDNVINQALIKAQLDSLQVTYDIVADGHQVLDAIQSNRHYDLIIMDCHMPNMDGITAAQKIRATSGPYQHIPIIALTADTMTHELNRCISAGMDDFIIKPFKQIDFQDVLGRWLK